jgi:hypothetical protein
MFNPSASFASGANPFPALAGNPDYGIWLFLLMEWIFLGETMTFPLPLHL